ncbi:hypothetical protein [Salmonella enterica]|uniref:hypothetical protein n=1 Tax=Salmonella enterica TaxID=28901 RepID=UPI001F06B5FF|nr:hypothetical protein [Salmonella enterica]
MWREVVQILLPTLATVAVRASTSGLQSAYEIIRSYLIYMENENSYAIKERYTVVKLHADIFKVITQHDSKNFSTTKNWWFH